MDKKPVKSKRPGDAGQSGKTGARIRKVLIYGGLAVILALLVYGGGEKATGTLGRLKRQPVRGQTFREPPQEAGRSGSDRQEAVQEPETQPAECMTEDARIRKRVALTFDDGPHPLYTEQLLDGLKQRDVKATFFVIGRNIPGNEDIIRRMAGEGHLIGNHTYDHVKISDLSGPEACEQIEKTSSLIRELTGSDTEFVRPPFGEWNKDLECTFAVIPVLWDVDPKDWLTKNTADIVRRVLEDTEDGDIILLHDYYESSVKAALEIVDCLKEQGYEFVTADELILV